jgi:hypothetical protein
LLAGVPAGTFTAGFTVPIVWWAFMPPQFEFNPLTQSTTTALFSSCCPAHW